MWPQSLQLAQSLVDVHSLRLLSLVLRFMHGLTTQTLDEMMEFRLASVGT